DEFAVLLRAAQDVREQALQVALRIQDALGEPYVYQQQTLHIGCSIGIALYPEHARHLEALYQAADDALYQAKADGRGAIVVCPHASPEPVNSDAAPVR
ncbi:MAG: GGDEF domain-containing protein, partial [Pseudomonas sp.]|nr:GGDEF domain-containing protein [Pseudomonas sp.]